MKNVLFVLLISLIAQAETVYYAGFNADDKAQKTLDGFALYFNTTKKEYSILAMREYPIPGDVHVYPGRLKGIFTESETGILTAKSLVMQFYDDYINSPIVCDVPVSMRLIWNKERTTIRAENVRFPKRYPKVYPIFGCERLKDSDMMPSVNLSFTRVH